MLLLTSRLADRRTPSRGSTHVAHKPWRSRGAVSEGVARGALGSERRLREVGLPLALGSSEDLVVDSQAEIRKHFRCSDWSFLVEGSRVAIRSLGDSRRAPETLASLASAHGSRREASVTAIAFVSPPTHPVESRRVVECYA